MTDIRELLRTATDDLVVDQPDPAARIRRATARRRRTAAAVIGVCVAVAAAIVVPLTVAGRSTPAVLHGPPPAGGDSIVQHWTPEDGQAATGFGFIWGLSSAGNGNPGTSWVDELNPATGARIRRFSIPAPTSHIATGIGRVWVIGQNAGGGGTSYITAINPATGKVQSMQLTDPRAAPYGIAFADGSAWVTMQQLNQVWRLSLTPAGITKSVIPLSGGVNQIATTGNGAIWVQRADAKRLSRIIPDGETGRVGASARWPGSIFIASPGAGNLWGTSGQIVTELDPGGLSSCPPCQSLGNGVRVPQRVLAVVNTPRGLYAASDRRTFFYDFRAVRDDATRPTASIPYGGGSLAPDGAGVLVGTGTAGLIHWVPRG